ncbi:MAG: pyridoxamine 5'-phosphate oxidase family protein [Actinomycetota bacterium]
MTRNPTAAQHDPGVRDRETRTADTLAMLTTQGIDVWVATASAAGAPYLVPVSLVWVDDRAVIAVAKSSLTATNLTTSGVARLAVGQTRDVVMIDAVLEEVVDVGTDEALGSAYIAQADWDPRDDTGYAFLVLRPVRVQAWREANEIPGRALMRDGAWLTEVEAE